MTNGNGNGSSNGHSSDERDEDYYSWHAEVLRAEDLDTEVNEASAKDAEIVEDEEGDE